MTPYMQTRFEDYEIFSYLWDTNYSTDVLIVEIISLVYYSLTIMLCLLIYNFLFSTNSVPLFGIGRYKFYLFTFPP